MPSSKSEGILDNAQLDLSTCLTSSEEYIIDTVKQAKRAFKIN